MGNFFNRCYAEENNEQQDKTQVSKIQISDQLSLQDNGQNNKNQDFQLLQEQIESNMKIYSLELKFNEDHFQFQLISTDYKLIFKDLTQLCNQSFNVGSQYLEQNQLKKLFDEPLLILSSDDIQQITSHQFQIQVSKQRYSLGEKYLGNLNETELLIAECIQANITTGLIPLFKSYYHIKFENNKLEKLFKGIYIIYLVCDFFQGILQKYLKEYQYIDNIKIYNLIYYQFQKLILNINYETEQIYNALPVFQKNYKFSLLGYAMRFWCQIVIANLVDGKFNKISKLLLESYRNVDKKGIELEIYKYIIGAIDLCSNEYTSNWIGHQNNYKIQNILIDMNHNELNTISYVGDFTSFTKEVDKKLEESRQFCPTWIFELNFLNYSLDLKLKNLMQEIKDKYKFENDSQSSVKENIQLSYNELPTGYGLFDENEKADDMESQMRVMAKFLFIDQNVQPKSYKAFAQEPYYSAQPSDFRSPQKISLPLSQLKILPNQQINEKVKNINPKYFNDLKTIRVQYKRVLRNIKHRNTILEIRNQNRQIDNKILNNNYESSQEYNYFVHQKYTNKTIEEFVNKWNSIYEVVYQKEYQEQKEQQLKQVNYFFEKKKI
ncbi:unnamed protein product [Paramecium primaurelia]|uniref:Uncharacterized protein n=1 Tax=Paramecium primaurelia TaxID=5886 RepID=A0A8S1KJA9_PARPR|nr:unnamed protein product [Paramecium primaurelia]